MLKIVNTSPIATVYVQWRPKGGGRRERRAKKTNEEKVGEIRRPQIFHKKKPMLKIANALVEET